MESGDGPDLVMLLAEDNPADVFLAKEALQEAGFGYELHVARDGFKALDFLREKVSTGEPLPDLIVLDLNLPGRSGREIMAEIQGHPRLKRLPVAILSTSEIDCDVGKEFPGLQTLFAAKSGAFDALVETMRRFKRFADEAARLDGERQEPGVRPAP